jgi:DNA-binding NarL/FixJ family response regulator
MQKEDVLSDDFRKCCASCIMRKGLERTIKYLGYTIDDFIDHVIASAWLSTKLECYAIGTIASRQVIWSLSKMLRKRGVVYPTRDVAVENRKFEIDCVLTGRERFTLDKYSQGYNMKEIGNLLGCCGETVSTIMESGVEKIKRQEKRLTHY